MNILGISAFFHDSAACILQDGVLTAAAQEERFSRRKHDPSIPVRAVQFCLEQADLSICEIDAVGYYENPALKLERQLWTNLPGLTTQMGMRMWLRARQPFSEIRDVLGYEGPVQMVEHHLAHAASAFHFSGFEEAALFTLDGVGEWSTTSYGRGSGADVELFEEVSFPNSLGLLYSTLTSFLGFAVNDGEYKVMGLAPYGRTEWVSQIRELIKIEDRGQFLLNSRYFDFASEKRMYTGALEELFGRQARPRGSPIEQFHKDVARSLQLVLEEVVLEKCAYLYSKTGSENLCMAGGVALNCVANARIRQESPFRRLFVQPAAGDAGACLGAATLAHCAVSGSRPRTGAMGHAYLGGQFSSEEIASLIAATPVRAADYRGRERALLDAVVDRLCRGGVVGWFQGRMEFGPRALGARSILADPRDGSMRDRINALVKKREAFRPFAPAVPVSRAAEFFDLDHASPFMLETCQVKANMDLPAVTHVDNSARVQTVDAETNPQFSKLIELFGERTGCPVLLNTSFNVRDEPIVCTPVDALRCFAKCDIDALVLEDFLIDRSGLDGAWIEQLRSVDRGGPPSFTDNVYTFL